MESVGENNNLRECDEGKSEENNRKAEHTTAVLYYTHEMIRLVCRTIASTWNICIALLCMTVCYCVQCTHTHLKFNITELLHALLLSLSCSLGKC
jgi:hypothetical protein